MAVPPFTAGDTSGEATSRATLGIAELPPPPPPPPPPPLPAPVPMLPVPPAPLFLSLMPRSALRSTMFRAGMTTDGWLRESSAVGLLGRGKEAEVGPCSADSTGASAVPSAPTPCSAALGATGAATGSCCPEEHPRASGGSCRCTVPTLGAKAGWAARPAWADPSLPGTGVPTVLGTVEGACAGRFDSAQACRLLRPARLMFLRSSGGTVRLPPSLTNHIVWLVTCGPAVESNTVVKE
jgi:hypothetical protein